MVGVGGASTRCGARPQAILHPSGNRGADLIETIRLERLSSELADHGPHPHTRLFIRPHHTDPAARTKPSRPGIGGPGERAWAEKAWTRPQSAGAMHVHSSNALNDMLAADVTDRASDNAPSRLSSPLPAGVAAGSPAAGATASFGAGGSQTLSSVVASKPAAAVKGKQRPQSAMTMAEMRQRQRLQQKYEEQQERVMRKLKESQAAAAAQQEEDFNRAWEQFHTEQNGAVADIERMLRLKDIEAVRRANATSKQWEEEVFERIQGQITRELRKREADGRYNTRWRHAQDEYLRALKKKDAGVFRDIVIENEYDPLETMKSNIKYSSKRVNLKDPLKTELRTHAQEARMVPGSDAARLAEAAANRPLGRACFEVEKWAKMEATPYGHFNHILTQEAKGRPRRPMPTSGARVMGDHYTRTTVPLRVPEATPLE